MTGRSWGWGRRRTAVWIASGIAVTTLGACSAEAEEPTATETLEQIEEYHVVPDQPLGPAAGAITLTDGSRWSYADPAEDRITLLYFGYTSCPDVCPTTLADISAALRQLPEEDRQQVRVQFVSTDPTRDTPQRMDDWTHAYSPDFEAGRAPIAQVVEDAGRYGIGIEPPKVSKQSYEVSHGSQVVVLDPDGGGVGYFSGLAGADVYAKALPTLIEEYA